METLSTFIDVLVITMLGICFGFAVFLWKHNKDSKKEKIPVNKT
jgi:hypothetical protein